MRDNVTNLNWQRQYTLISRFLFVVLTALRLVSLQLALMAAAVIVVVTVNRIMENQPPGM